LHGKNTIKHSEQVNCQNFHAWNSHPGDAARLFQTILRDRFLSNTWATCLLHCLVTHMFTKNEFSLSPLLIIYNTRKILSNIFQNLARLQASNKFLVVIQ